MAFMTPQEIAAFQPDPLPQTGSGPAGRTGALQQARAVMQQLGLWSPKQQMGSRWPIGCVALEITQRCNLDCTLCYLSEHSEAVRDIPLQEIFRRIELIHRHYGDNTDVQITGGDPTLRKKQELLAIVQKVRSMGMRPTLMTNGIKASRSLLEDLVEAGLADVAFHVDTTQERKGFANEVELNKIRLEYIERAKDLPLSIFFNTTVHQGNFHEIPELVRFFRTYAHTTVRTVSFQLQADTGRGVERKRADCITTDRVLNKIQQGAETKISFERSHIGHPDCSRYGLCLAVNGNLHDFLDDEAFFERLQWSLRDFNWDRSNIRKTIVQFFYRLLKNPRLASACAGWASRKAWQLRNDFIASRGRVSTLSFVVHNFMDACSLDCERIQACVFKTMTVNGPISMCMHNAKRDEFILKPIAISTENGQQYWQPLTGKMDSNSATPVNLIPDQHKLKHLKGRSRRNLLLLKSG